jgi:outer membrane protein OmpA-like peptidoglycan-associated protein
MLRYVMAVGLLMLAGCADIPGTGSPGAGRQVAQSPCASSSYRTAGPCYDGTDITDRTPRDDQRDITVHVAEDTRDITDRRSLDDVTDRTVWCDEVGAVIRAPSFMVFFDWDRSDLSAQALDTIRQAANAYKTQGGARVTATGHTDRSGPETYNMALSLRRANAVRDALVHEGVRATDISVVGRGETQPLVPTADGVRESQNRRVEIVLRDGN